MDARLSLKDSLWSNLDVQVIINAGGIAIADEAIRSLIISHELSGTEKFVFINHIDCGMLTFKNENFKKFQKKHSTTASTIKFHAFSNLEQNVKDQIEKEHHHIIQISIYDYICI
jgi:carbonic anhydrase